MSKPSKQKEERWRKQELAEAIVEYLREHPRASDTLDGIAEWWIMRQHVRVELNTVKNVLRQLIAEGVLREIGEGGSRRYSLNVKRDDLR